MKTFKMLAFDLLLNDEIKEIPLTDGIIINQENSHKMWILELFTADTYYDFFQKFVTSGEVLDARAIISLPDNEPAPFAVVVHSITKVGDKISVLIKGRLKAQRKKYAELLLAQLLEDGLRNDELLEAFDQGMRNRPSLQKNNEEDRK